MNNKIHLVAVDMGYGHQRAVYPLLEFSREGALNLNDYTNIESWEKSYWLNSQKTYEKISYFKRIPVAGSLVFKAMDYFQQIDKFYPRRDLSPMTTQQKMFFGAIKKGVSRGLISELAKEPLPFVTSFFVAAYGAEYYNYPGDIYCIVCDADISRAWAPIDPKNSRIKYFAPNERGRERLKMYGVPANNIIVTGFPLPLENIGENDEILRDDLGKRIVSLDPLNAFRKTYENYLKNNLDLPAESGRPLTITFAVGGAGAQREIGSQILKKLQSHIKEGKIKLNLIAGAREDVNSHFTTAVAELGLENNENVRIIYHPQKMEYFRQFNECLRETDVLWTKPSELSFYSGLGLPIIMSEPVGSQEHFNREWLISIGAGLDSPDPEYVAEWLLDWRRDGRLARAAFNAFLNAPRNGVRNIKKALFNENL
ncbi:hypothetical protein CVU83_00385 [Candidatus Falkowbacteria bacterium HGW-Falkowbacteria-2]|uniref:DUF6938 domain-containing protein n=1 Tax=Candidatus Falkowbacteria bacterium HGW-Falkowbacteria-2 TaxID=2013769 RepID=A0A2N2E3H1_9BACT|nr:MAG: hypothetical protein CVU83_00385 [Candidatus Falkowbacteria bacterium HGW-Falkowbacteria-2]